VTFPLIVQAEGSEPRVFTGKFTIGQRGDLVVSDAYASSYHAACYPDEHGDWFVEDLGSTNGTQLNRRPIWGPQPLGRGDQVRVGHTTLIVVPA
jgi:pSer/pThr/pTyr-binding forkhead associated (FHA) protein